jgi:hypothetical protein
MSPEPSRRQNCQNELISIITEIIIINYHPNASRKPPGAGYLNSRSLLKERLRA